MSALQTHNRRHLVAAGAVLTLAAGAFGLAAFFPALGPVMGTVAPQLYVDSFSGAQIPRDGQFLLVDAKSARLYMIEDGRVQDSMRVIVGKAETPTPELTSVIKVETLNPYWHVSPDLVKTIIAPRVLKDGDAYLNQQGYEVVANFRNDAPVIAADSVDWKAVAAGDVPIQVRQKPGPANSLGRFKFQLPNSDGIFLHDTPKKDLFAQDKRDLSHGCVRLEDAPKLARWLLGKDPPAATVPEENIELPHPVPVTISYLDPRSQAQLAMLR